VRRRRHGLRDGAGAAVAGTCLDLLDTRKSARLEWYIIILIAIEIVLFIRGLFGRP